MKRSTFAALLLGAAGLCLACSDSSTTEGAAGLSGTYDVTLYEKPNSDARLDQRLIFVTSKKVTSNSGFSPACRESP